MPSPFSRPYYRRAARRGPDRWAPRDRVCPTPVVVGCAPEVVIVTASSRGRQRRHRSGVAAPVLAATPMLPNARPILVAGSDRDLAEAVSSVMREFRARRVREGRFQRPEAVASKTRGVGGGGTHDGWRSCPQVRARAGHRGQSCRRGLRRSAGAIRSSSARRSW
jgi:hypothetical protein